jgi:hypothetical protein
MTYRNAAEVFAQVAGCRRSHCRGNGPRAGATAAIVYSSVRTVAGLERGRARSVSLSAPPVQAQREMGVRLVAIDLDCDVFDEGAQQLLPVAWRVLLRSR